MPSTNDDAAEGRAASKTASLAAFALVLVGAAALYAVPLHSYWLHYFPYEDDFALLRYSAGASPGGAAAWFTSGYSSYFHNSPSCPANLWGFARPLVNITYYLESLILGTGGYSVYLLTNLAVFLASIWLLLSMARALQLGLRMGATLALIYAASPVWYRILLHSSFRPNGLCTLFMLSGIRLLLPHAVQPPERTPVRRQLAAGLCGLAAVMSHEQGYSVLPMLVALLLFSARGRGLREGIRGSMTGTLRVAGPSLLYVAAMKVVNPAFGHNYALSSLSGSGALDLLVVGLFRSLFLFTPLELTLLSSTTSLYLCVLALGNLLILGALGLILVRARWRSAGLVVLGACYLLAAAPIIAYAGAERRFQGTVVALGLLLLGSAYRAVQNRSLGLTSFVVAGLAGIGLFNGAVFGREIAAQRQALQARNDSDRRSFADIAGFLAANPEASVVLVNNQFGTWGADAMIRLAGLGERPVVILPSAVAEAQWVSYDFAMFATPCRAGLEIDEEPARIVVRLAKEGDHCRLAVFGADLRCLCSEFERQGLADNCRQAGTSYPQGRAGGELSSLADRMQFFIPKSRRPVAILFWPNRGEAMHAFVYYLE